MNVVFRFRGEFTHSLDEKGRLALPGKLREELQKSEHPEEVTAHANRDGYVTIYPYEQWLKIEDKINEISDIKVRTATARMYIGNSERLSVDKSGRVLLTAAHRSLAGLVREVIILGSGFKLEIWEHARLKAQRAEDEAVMAEALNSLEVPL